MVCDFRSLVCYSYLEVQGDLVSSLMTPITHIVTLVIPLLTHLLSPLEPPSSPLNFEPFRVQGSRMLLRQVKGTTRAQTNMEAEIGS